MILKLFPKSVKKVSCPHTRGDDPNFALKDDQYLILSPHAWG